MAATKLATVLADFTTSLATAMAVGATSVTLQSATDDDGVALPAGKYFFTLDGGNSSKEHIVCTLSGTSLTSISSVSRQGVQASGCVRAHRIGATVSLTDFAHLKYINDYLIGTTDFPAGTPLKYDAAPTLTPGSNEFATVAYADAISVAGAANATTTTKGIVEIATQAEVEAGTATGGTGATLAVPAGNNGARFFSGYAADAGSNDTYVVTLAPVPSAYFTGMIVSFKANTVNTGAATINCNSLGAKDIRRNNGLVLANGDIAAGQFILLQYNGTYFEILSQIGRPQVSTSGVEIYAADSVGTDAYAITVAPAPTAYSNGMVFRFLAGTANTSGATLNVNGLGAIAITKNYNAALATGDILANQIVEVIYDGTQFQMLSSVASIVPSPAQLADSENSTSSTLTGTTAETTLATLTLPANKMLANGGCKIVVYWKGTNSGGGAGSQTMKIKFGGTILATHTRSSTSGSADQMSICEIGNRNATNSQVAISSHFANDGANPSLANVAGATAAIDTTSAVTILITGTLTNTAHTMTCEEVLVTALPLA